MAWILFVDDDPYALEIYKRAVEIFGHRAIVTGTGKEALALAREYNPDMIFLDMRMPDMSGFELLGYLQDDEEIAKIPAVMLTASNHFENEELAKKAGAVAFIQKPIHIDEMSKLIDKYSSFGVNEQQT
ncbi:MAG TPA: response regulator [Anaerolineae bacterium]|nr:response regulator [Anaerolineae bacterium]